MYNNHKFSYLSPPSGQRRDWQLDAQRDQDALRMRSLGRRLVHRRADRDKENGGIPSGTNPQATARSRGGTRQEGRGLELRRSRSSTWKPTGTVDHRSRSK